MLKRTARPDINGLSNVCVKLGSQYDAGLSVKTASKAPLYADAGIEISSIPASASSVIS